MFTVCDNCSKEWFENVWINCKLDFKLQHIRQSITDDCLVCMGMQWCILLRRVIVFMYKCKKCSGALQICNGVCIAITCIVLLCQGCKWYHYTLYMVVAMSTYIIYASIILFMCFRSTLLYTKYHATLHIHITNMKWVFRVGHNEKFSIHDIWLCAVVWVVNIRTMELVTEMEAKWNALHTDGH